MVLVALLFLTGSLSAAAAEAETYKPRIECGDRAPQGKVVYNGKRQQERLGPVVGHHPQSEDIRYSERYAILKGSKCWVRFWSVEIEGFDYSKQRYTGKFVETLQGDDRKEGLYGNFFGYDQGRSIILKLDPSAVACQEEPKRIVREISALASKGASTPEHQARYEIALKQVDQCLEDSAKALDQRGFVGMWYSSAVDMDRYFAVLDGKLIVWTATPDRY
jgi:hypothetical protein